MRFLFVAGVSLLFIPAAVRPAAAHPLTDVRYDRTAAVRLSAEGVEVRYSLELSLLALHLDAARRLTPAQVASLDRTAIGYARAYAKAVAAELAERLNVAVDGKPIPLEVASIDVDITDHAVCRYLLRAAWPPGGRDRKLSVADRTFLNMPGILNLTLDRRGGSGNTLELLDSEDPPARVRLRPLEQLSVEDAALARTASAEIRLPSVVGSSTQKGGLGTAAAGESPAISPLDVQVNSESPPKDLAGDMAQRGLIALFDSPLGIGFLLMAAFLFGAAHAFTPGHGKTLVAAYLIGERGTVRHAIVLALVTTLTHTGSVIAMAAILWGVYGNDIPVRTQGTLQLVAGMLVVGVGLWLLLRRATGQADHFHLFGGHHHHHDGGDRHHHHHATGHHHGDGGHNHPESADKALAHQSHNREHSHPHEHVHSHSHSHSHGDSHSHTHDHHHNTALPAKVRSTTSWVRVVLMGMGGGMVPCWDAVLLLVAAAALNRVGFAIPLLLAFSAGLGTVLVGLGIGVVYAYRAGTVRFREQRWFRYLPVVSALFLIAVGVWLCQSAVRAAM